MKEKLILVPGLMCDESVWDSIIPLVNDKYECFVVNHGSANSIKRMAEQILDSMPGSFSIVGHSMGGRVALEVLRHDPSRVKRIALMDTGYKKLDNGKAGEEEIKKRYALFAIAKERGIRSMAQVWVQDMIHVSRLNDEKLINSILDMFERKSIEIFECQIKALLNRPDATGLLPKIRVPTLILCGKEDKWSPPHQHQTMHQLIPNSFMEIVENAGHMTPMERPREVASAILKWMSFCSI